MAWTPPKDAILADSAETRVGTEKGRKTNTSTSTGWTPPADAVPAEATKSVNKTESGVAGAVQGATFGFADEVTGAVKGAYRRVTEGGSFGDQYTKARDETRQYFKEAEDANPNSYLAGQVTGGVVASLIPVAGQAGRLAQGASLASRVGAAAKAGAIVGGAGGAGYSEGQTVSDVIADTATGAATGAAIGGALPVAGTIARKTVETAKLGVGAAKEIGDSTVKIISKASPSTGTLIRRALTPEGNLTAATAHAFAGDLAGAAAWGTLGAGRVAYRALKGGKPASVAEAIAPNPTIPNVTTKQEAEVIKDIIAARRAEAAARNAASGRNVQSTL